MIMNSNVVYGSAMPCHTSGLVAGAGAPVPGSEYSAHHHHPHHHHAHHHQGYFNPDISSYYQTATAVANSVAVPPAAPTSAGGSASPPTSDHQQQQQLGGQQQQQQQSSTPPSAQHYAAGFHMPAAASALGGHPFADLSSHVVAPPPPTALGIISESNGLSYTNLDINNQNGYVSSAAHAHYQRLGQYGPSGSVVPTSHPSSQCNNNNNASSPQLSSGSSSASSGSSTTPAASGNSLYPFTKCDSYDPSPPSPPSSGPNSGGSVKCEPHDMLTSLGGDCGGLGGRGGPNAYASYFDSSSLLPSRSSRNATPLGQHQHAMQHLSNGLVNGGGGGGGSASPYGLDVGGLGVSAYADMSCGALNGGTYHPHHVPSGPHPHHHLGGGHHHHHLSHLQGTQPHHHQQQHQPPPQHASPNSRGNLSNTNAGLLTSAAPVTQYKWMQVKRNIPKPGKSSALVPCVCVWWSSSM